MTVLSTLIKSSGKGDQSRQVGVKCSKRSFPEFGVILTSFGTFYLDFDLIDGPGQSAEPAIYFGFYRFW